MITMTSGKFENLKKLSTKKGIIAAAAMDQRGSLQKAIAKEKGIEKNQVTKEMMVEFKTAVAQEKLLAPNGIVVVEHSPREKIEEGIGLAVTDQRKYGQTCISFLK